MRVYSLGLPLLLLAGAALLVGCKKEEKKDTQKPEIRLHGPEEGAKVEIGKTMHFEADFTDWGGKLASYKVDIHNNFKPHSHSNDAVKPVVTLAEEQKGGEEMVPFSFEKEWPLKPYINEHIHHHEIEIKAPEGKKIQPGSYHIVVYCADQAGNQSHVAHTIQLVESEAHEHGEGAHFHVERFPVKDAYYFSEIISCALEGHSEDDPVKEVRVMLLPSEVVDKDEAAWQTAATPDKCFAVIAHKVSEEAGGKKELEVEGGLTIGADKDNEGGEGKGKLIKWERDPEKAPKYVLYAAGETVGGKKFYLAKSKAKIVEIKFKRR